MRARYPDRAAWGARIAALLVASLLSSSVVYGRKPSLFPIPILDTAAGVFDVVFNDFDQDGHLDIAALLGPATDEPNGRVRVFRGLGDGQFRRRGD